MDGAFVAYHNVNHIQGFEYISNKEIDRRVFGTEHYAETTFAVCSKLATKMFDEIIEYFKDEHYETLKIGVYAHSPQRKLILFVEIFRTKEDL